MALQNVVLASLVDFPASEARRVVFPSSAGGRQSGGSGFSPLDYRNTRNPTGNYVLLVFGCGAGFSYVS